MGELLIPRLFVAGGAFEEYDRVCERAWRRRCWDAGGRCRNHCGGKRRPAAWWSKQES